MHLKRKHHGIGEPIESIEDATRKQITPRNSTTTSAISPHARKNSSPFEITNELMRGACEYIRLPDPTSWYSPVSNTTASQFNHQFLEYVNFGCESYICPGCLINDALPFGGVKGSDEIIRTERSMQSKEIS